jgi:predicted flap endonuclease-1-like 5' DNA nuclease
MSSILSTFGCCFWWFLFGTLLGWLLNRWLCSCCCKATPCVSAPAAATKMADVPAAPAPKAAPEAKAPKPTVIDIKAAKAAGFALKHVNDLTIIEGIGPKINELFNNAGLKTFAQVAAASVAEMRAILDNGGSRFRIANPGTWAQQAALAAENKWEALKKLQDELSAGIKK